MLSPVLVRVLSRLIDTKRGKKIPSPRQAGIVKAVFVVLGKVGYKVWAGIEGIPYCDGAQVQGN